MSIILSLITNNFAILKSDTRGTANGKPLPFVCPKGIELEKDGNVILLTFCGVLNIGGINTFDRIKSEKDALFAHYETHNSNVAWVIGEYLRQLFFTEISKATDIKGNETVRIHIVTKKDFEKRNPIICQVWIDLRKKVKEKDEATIFGLDQNYRFWSAGGDLALHGVDKDNTNERFFSELDFAGANHLLDAKMRIAIAVDSTCGEPIDTFSFRF